MAQLDGNTSKSFIVVMMMMMMMMKPLAQPPGPRPSWMASPGPAGWQHLQKLYCGDDDDDDEDDDDDDDDDDGCC